MFGIRKLWARLTGNKTFQKVEHVALEFVSRAGLQHFINEYQGLAIQRFKDLAVVHNTEDIKVWVSHAKAELEQAVKADAKEFHATWFEMLFSAAVETWQAHQEEVAATATTQPLPPAP